MVYIVTLVQKRHVLTVNEASCPLCDVSRATLLLCGSVLTHKTSQCLALIFQRESWLARSHVRTIWNITSTQSLAISWWVFFHRTNTSAQDGWTTSTSSLTHTDNVPEQQGRETHTEQPDSLVHTWCYDVIRYLFLYHLVALAPQLANNQQD